jgi:uncharacterized protein (DUF2345 family)
MANNPNTLSGSTSEPEVRPGPLIATVVSHLDKEYAGKLEVDIGRPGGGTGTESQLHQVSYMSPFYGSTAATNVRQDPDNYDSTQKSYGMWMIPPDIGTQVIVIFIDGNPKYGFWLGAVQNEGMNFMLPGIAATENVVDGAGFNDAAGRAGRVPVAEFNRKINTGSPSDVTKWLKPSHPLTDILTSQGLILDDVRGITTSSARREAPSSVFGISTPGPLDKRPDSPTGPYGKPEHEIPNYPASRLGGSTFVMDDGDDKFLRKTSAKEGPPEYASTDNKETDGDPAIPHNELVRIRTRTGHQILLHNSEDLIYITNSRGTAWIELTSNGKIDIYAQDSISVHTEQDFNFYAGRDFNFEAGRNFNLKVAERHQTEIGKDKITIVKGKVAIQVDGTHDETIGGQAKITVGGGLNIKTSGKNTLTSGGNMEINAANTTISGGNINLNGPAAATAQTATKPKALKTFDNPVPDNSNVPATEGTPINSIMLRIPTTEPYPLHENLDPTNLMPDNTDRESGSAGSTPDGWQTYSTITDTFSRVKGPEEEQQQ